MPSVTPTTVKPVPITTILLDTAALVLLGQALINLLLDRTAGPDAMRDGNALLQSLYAGIYALYALRFALNAEAQQALRCLLDNDRWFWLPVAAVLTLALASTAWSSAPQVTLRRAIALIGTTGVGLYLALRYSAGQFLRLLLGASVVFAISSIVMVLIRPERGLMEVLSAYTADHAGRWRGVFLHKNRLGRMMAVGVVVAAGMLRRRNPQLLIAFFALLLCLFVLLLAESLTALFATAAALLAVSVLRLRAGGTHDGREKLLAILPLLLLAISASIYQYSQSAAGVSVEETAALMTQSRTNAPSALLQEEQQAVPPEALQRGVGFSRNATAIGRLNIWRLSWEALQQQPLLGYGYNAFWRSGGPAEQVWQQYGFRAPHAHNGWIDLALELGIPLTLLAAFWMLWLGGRMLRTVFSAGGPEEKSAAIVLFGLWICLNVINLAETVLFRQNDIFTVLIFAIAVWAAVHVPVREGRH